MELWIRSQDKDELVKVENIKLIYDTLCSNEVQLIHIYSDKVNLGSYATKKRALEVLDEIEKLLNPILVFKNCECDNDTLKAIKEIGACMVNNNSHIEQIQTCIYEMPKE